MGATGARWRTYCAVDAPGLSPLRTPPCPCPVYITVGDYVGASSGPERFDCLVRTDFRSGGTASEALRPLQLVRRGLLYRYELPAASLQPAPTFAPHRPVLSPMAAKEAGPDLDSCVHPSPTMVFRRTAFFGILF